MYTDRWVAQVEQARRRIIKEIEFDGDGIDFHFEDGSKLKIWDGGQSCCEARYITTDDTLDYFHGAEFLGAYIGDYKDVESDDYYGDVHEVQFLHIKTSFGVITFETHNEHNGYYGGFSIQAEYICSK